MKKRILLLFITYLYSTVSYSANILANEKEDTLTWYQVTFDNDVMSRLHASDDGYTNGLLFAWAKAPVNDFKSIDMPDWIRFISAWTYLDKGAEKDYSLAYALSQSMYTPQDISQPDLIENDRPYAGTLLWQAKLRSYANNRVDSLALSLGVVGPASLAQQTQDLMHQWIGASKPRGWDHQIKNEPVFRLTAEHVERFYTYKLTPNISFDSSLYSEVGIGNLRSDIGTGITLRLGTSLDDNYASINPTSSAMQNSFKTDGAPWQWQAFTSLYASYLFNDITLNGNTFADSHYVDIIPQRLLLSLGVAISYKKWGMIFSVQHANKDFEGQESNNQYGSLSVTYHY
ncbi:hypothetical protein PCNPT3_10615 [Psychromonas sp. CNPT3]|uniref:lipid A deacylase LpxR family protein n=1 Tax=Psychromonas sp. CNPT3 TaxID=314282 RepID=UPI00006E78FF|nr:lipid A deacylase LpxR family protein [Psychromonas sp. CNPT3]AGH82061.1 hypothetical protein PCNPT3_10615 [Psychromonas sp. CNPT3]